MRVIEKGFPSLSVFFMLEFVKTQYGGGGYLHFQFIFEAIILHFQFMFRSYKLQIKSKI